MREPKPVITFDEHAMYGVNIYKVPINVKHSELKRVSVYSAFKSECPVCKEGLLLLVRDSKTFKLLAEDRCILCGQQFIYSDIDELSKRLW